MKPSNAASHGPWWRGIGVLLVSAPLCLLAPASGHTAADGRLASAGDVRLAPDFSLPGLADELVSLKALQGDVVYVDFWASWCPPCLQSFPWMQEIAERYRVEGLQVVAINLDVERAAAERFLSGLSVNFAVAFDPAGTAAAAYDLAGMPSSFVIDREGRTLYQHVGFRTQDTAALEAAIEQALMLADPASLEPVERGPADPGSAVRRP